MNKVRSAQERAMEHAGYKRLAMVHKGVKDPSVIVGIWEDKGYTTQLVSNYDAWMVLYGKKVTQTPKSTETEHATLEDHFNSPFYAESNEYRESVRANQIRKGADKYPEPFNPLSWTSKQLLEHAMQENVDQSHYIYGMYKQIDFLTGELTDIISKTMMVASRVKDNDIRQDLIDIAKVTNGMLKRVIGYESQQGCQKDSKPATGDKQ